MPAVSLATTTLATTDISKEITMTALTTASNSDYITIAGADEDYAIIISNADATHDATVVLSASTGGLLGAMGTVSITVAATKTVYFALRRASSARIVNQTGTNAGKIIANTTIASGGDITKVTFGVVLLN